MIEMYLCNNSEEIPNELDSTILMLLDCKKFYPEDYLKIINILNNKLKKIMDDMIPF